MSNIVEILGIEIVEPTYSGIVFGLPEIPLEDDNGSSIQTVMQNLRENIPGCVVFIPKKIDQHLSEQFPGGVVYCCYAGIVDIDSLLKGNNIILSSMFNIDVNDIPEGIDDPLALLAIQSNNMLTKEETLKYVNKLTPEFMVYLAKQGIYVNAPTVIQYYCDLDINEDNVKKLLHFAVFLIKYDILEGCGYNRVVNIFSNVNILGCYIDLFDECLQDLLYCYVEEIHRKHFENSIEIVYNFD